MGGKKIIRAHPLKILFYLLPHIFYQPLAPVFVAVKECVLFFATHFSAGPPPVFLNRYQCYEPSGFASVLARNPGSSLSVLTVRQKMSGKKIIHAQSVRICFIFYRPFFTSLFR